MNIFKKIGRWLAGRAGGTAAVAAYDAAPDASKGEVVIGAAKDLAQQKVIDKYKPVAIALVDSWAEEYAAKSEALVGQTKDAIERELVRRIEASTFVPAAASATLQIAVSTFFDRIDTKPYVDQGRAGVYLLADKVKAAINGARL